MNKVASLLLCPMDFQSLLFHMILTYPFSYSYHEMYRSFFFCTTNRPPAGKPENPYKLLAFKSEADILGRMPQDGLHKNGRSRHLFPRDVLIPLCSSCHAVRTDTFCTLTGCGTMQALLPLSGPKAVHNAGCAQTFLAEHASGNGV